MSTERSSLACAPLLWPAASFPGGIICSNFTGANTSTPKTRHSFNRICCNVLMPAGRIKSDSKRIRNKQTIHILLVIHSQLDLAENFNTILRRSHTKTKMRHSNFQMIPWLLWRSREPTPTPREGTFCLPVILPQESTQKPNNCFCCKAENSKGTQKSLVNPPKKRTSFKKMVLLVRRSLGVIDKEPSQRDTRCLLTSHEGVLISCWLRAAHRNELAGAESSSRALLQHPLLSEIETKLALLLKLHKNRKEILTDVFHRTRTKFRAEHTSSNRFEIMNNEGPKMQNVVASYVVPHFHHGHFCAK